MSNICSMCGIKTIFYVWTTGRKFPLDKYLTAKKITNKRLIKEAKYQGHVVCFHCLEELKERRN